MVKSSKKWIIGIDEVGRGPIAGPVYVCGVAIKIHDYKKARWIGLTDSKKLTQKAREKWYTHAAELEQKGVVRIGVASQTASRIDKSGISKCIKDCIGEILETLDIDPKDVSVVLDGGLKAPSEYLYQETIIKGDLKEKIISLASVVAKVSRDAYMVKIAAKYPGYKWEKNKGYGTTEHYTLLKKLGFTRLHRKTFLKRILDN